MQSPGVNGVSVIKKSKKHDIKPDTSNIEEDCVQVGINIKRKSLISENESGSAKKHATASKSRKLGDHVYSSLVRLNSFI